MTKSKTPWRSLETRDRSPEYLESIQDEFPVHFTQAPEPEGVNRRQFLSLMGATVGVAGATAGCIVRKPVQNIMPYSNRPEDRVPGKPWFYATSAFLAGSVIGLLVESQDGRPTKIEGNPDHPQSKGATNAWAQAWVNSLYDPDRTPAPIRKGSAAKWADWDEFAKTHFAEYAANGGAGLALLLEAVPSPSLNAAIGRFSLKYPAAKVYRHDMAERKNVSDGLALAGKPGLRPSYDLKKAKVVVALDSDLLGNEGDAVRNVWDFTEGRRLGSEKDAMNRLYVVEAGFSITGTQADNRLRLKSAQVGVFLKALVAKLFSQGLAVPAGAEPVPPALQGAGGDAQFEKWVAAVSKDLADNRGAGVVVAGDRQPAAVHALAALVNQALGNNGQTVTYVPTTLPVAGTLADLSDSIKANGVKTLVVLGGNPVYTAPADLQFPGLFAAVPETIRLGYFTDETGKAASWQLPESHGLETWGDLVAGDGTVSPVQPLIAPLFESRSGLELLAQINGEETRAGHDIVQAFWRDRHAGLDFEKTWRRWLHDGVIQIGAPTAPTAFDWSTLAGALGSIKTDSTGLELNLVAANAIYDGRFANNSWLQEMPDALTKVTWDNVVLVSPATARENNLEMGKLTARGKDAPVIEITVGDRKLEAPAWITPGVADGVLVLSFGYGRDYPSKVCQGAGVNAYALATLAQPFIQDGVSIRATGTTRRMADTQEHGDMAGRPILRETDLEEYRHEPQFAKEAVEVPELNSLWKETSYSEGMQWGMSIDLTACNGCNACLVACVAENNIPVVGRERVAWGREMHWIRLDRYFIGDENDPKVSMQPMACAQCEMAPCEGVCPVAATVHSPEGLNDMAYNRCIGTRYCSNNCPYKVRRFNFFNYNKEPLNKDPDQPELSRMQDNPDVTVRFRGVMEKCTYCIQRINEARSVAKRNGSAVIPDGAFKTACEQACPTQAIVFGNINDPESRVSKKKAINRDYAILAEFNIRPRTTYLAKIRNPNPDLAS